MTGKEKGLNYSSTEAEAERGVSLLFLALYKLYEEIWREFERHDYVLDGLAGVRKAKYRQFLN